MLSVNQKSMLTTPLYADTFQEKALVRIMQAITLELLHAPAKLMALNPSRRTLIAAHLDALAGNREPRSLIDWLDQPRSHVQQLALETYCRETASIAAGQIYLLKNWKRPLKVSVNLNWAISSTLKPLMPLDREGWQLTRPNLYSWYSPSPSLQQEIIDIMSHEPPLPFQAFLDHMQDHSTYDAHFLQAAVKKLTEVSLTPSFQRQRMVFCPTLRSGVLAHLLAQQSYTPIGLEISALHLMLAELGWLWDAPKAPPLWCTGTGLEVYGRDQLAFELTYQKPTVLSKITDIESFDAAIVCEEQSVRNKSTFQTEKLDAFRKIRSSSTTLGMMQAAISLSKLRPGGMLFWARHEPLSSRDDGMLGFLLQRARLLHEWNMTAVESNLSIPKACYLFERDKTLDVRLNHRPMRHQITGQATQKNLTALFSDQSTFGLHTQQSPSIQKDWMEKWPESIPHTVFRYLDALQASSKPLASFATVRPTPESSSLADDTWSLPISYQGFWIRVDALSNSILPSHLPAPEQKTKGRGYLVILTAWHALAAYLRSRVIQQWLDVHAERKSGRWILSDQVMKWIPVPDALLLALKGETLQESAWQEHIENMTHTPEATLSAVKTLDSRNPLHCQYGAHIFIKAAELKAHHALFQPEHSWTHVMQSFHDCIPLSLHPQIHLTGTLPPHVPVEKIVMADEPLPGIVLTTDSGYKLHLHSRDKDILHIIQEQLKTLSHPTWNEILGHIRVPKISQEAMTLKRNLEKSALLHSTQDHVFDMILDACPLFPHDSSLI